MRWLQPPGASLLASLPLFFLPSHYPALPPFLCCCLSALPACLLPSLPARCAVHSRHRAGGGCSGCRLPSSCPHVLGRVASTQCKRISWEAGRGSGAGAVAGSGYGGMGHPGLCRKHCPVSPAMRVGTTGAADVGCTPGFHRLPCTGHGYPIRAPFCPCWL